MLFSNSKNHIDKEIESLNRKENKLIEKRMESKESYIENLLDGKVPQKLQDTLDKAFEKSFDIVFTKGNRIIEKTYNREEYISNYEMDEQKYLIYGKKKHLKRFSKRAGGSKLKNIAISGVEGAGLGVFGIGIPDIPVFTGVLLKSIYEVAMSYGYDYESIYDRFFILKIIEISMKNGEEFKNENSKLNMFIEEDVFVEDSDVKSRIKSASKSISEGMLYMKFIQGIPVVGIAGGISNTVYVKRIVEYADMKYKRRFLMDKKRKNKAL